MIRQCYYALLILLFASVITFGYAKTQSQVSNPYPALAGGINQTQLQRCIKLLDIRCARRDGNSPYNLYASSCLYKYFDRLQCQQNKALYQQIGLMVESATRYGNIDVIAVKHYADGIGKTYMVDHDGRIIGLLNNADIKSLPNSQTLLQQHAKAVASDISVAKPTYILLPDGSQRLVFLQQILLEGTLVSRSTQWQLQVGYAFSAQGAYQGEQAIGLVQSNR